MSKETRPAFMFYASDWIAGTADLSHEEKGIFIDMLCQQWLRGSLPNDLNKLCRMFGGDANRNAIASILHKFCICENGDLQNAKLETVRESSRAASEKRSSVNSENARKRWQKPPKNTQEGQFEPTLEDKESDAIRNAIALRSESEYRDENRSENEGENRGVQGGNPSGQKFDASAASRAFQLHYRLKQGKPAILERAIAQAVQRNFSRNKIPFEETALLMSHAAKDYMAYHEKLNTATTYIPNPETFIDNDMWLTDWKAATKEARLGGATTAKEAAKEAMSGYSNPLMQAHLEREERETQKLIERKEAEKKRLEQNHG